MKLVTLTATTGQLRTTEQGHLIVPVVALRESVIHACNAAQAEFVPLATLADTVQRWPGRPVMLGHPMKDGKPVAAQEFIDSHSFGQIAAARISGSKLHMDIHIDPFKAKKVGAGRILERLRNNEICEVSVGCHVVTDKQPGVFDGEPYGCSWQSISPDHLAILENKAGACSVAAGCGTRAAQAFTWEDWFKIAEPPDGYMAALEAYRDNHR